MGSVRARKETGQLFMDFRIDGARCREQTSLPDNAVNRRKLEKLLAQVELEIKLGKFNYASHFPNSKLAQRFATSESVGVTVTATAVPVAQVAVPMATPSAGDRSPFFRDFIEEWIAENQIGCPIYFRIDCGSIATKPNKNIGISHFLDNCTDLF